MWGVSASWTIEVIFSQPESPTVKAILANTNVSVMIFLTFMLNLLYPKITKSGESIKETSPAIRCVVVREYKFCIQSLLIPQNRFGDQTPEDNVLVWKKLIVAHYFIVRNYCQDKTGDLGELRLKLSAYLP